MKKKTFAAAALAVCAFAAAIGPGARAADDAPAGAWRTTNGCFLVAFILGDGGRALAAYMTGEQDENAAWTWDGSKLTIASKTFDLDQFNGRLADGGIEADYVWHDLDNNRLNHQACTFERFTPQGF